ncbi:MAG: hypothetical protein HQ481_21660 [Alphaproteobacteria bacterium]|nr:hypothetical protein [Alphaproteobacteria bacterium]
MTWALTAINTRWIDRDGRDGDLRVRVGRLGDDISDFALHTLGWIRVLEIERFKEIRFDPRASGDGAAEFAKEEIRRSARLDEPWLMKIEIYSGRDWVECVDTDADRLTRFVENCLDFCREPQFPIGLKVEALDAEKINQLRHPMIQRVVQEWRRKQGRFDAGLQSILHQVTEGNTKLLRLGQDGRIAFQDYHRPANSGPWDPATWSQFSGATVSSVVPDRSLAVVVEKSARTALDSALPQLERCHGPLLTSKGVMIYDWMRASFPVWPDSTAIPGPGAQPMGLVVVCVTTEPELRAAS